MVIISRRYLVGIFVSKHLDKIQMEMFLMTICLSLRIKYFFLYADKHILIVLSSLSSEKRILLVTKFTTITNHQPLLKVIFETQTICSWQLSHLIKYLPLYI